MEGRERGGKGRKEEKGGERRGEEGRGGEGRRRKKGEEGKERGGEDPLDLLPPEKFPSYATD